MVFILPIPYNLARFVLFEVRGKQLERVIQIRKARYLEAAILDIAESVFDAGKVV
ncbi:hypothetical protein D3C78_1821850 [compost metagenome]